MSNAVKWKTNTVVDAKPVRVELEIDWQAVANELAPKAVRSKSGKATAIFGAVKVRVIKK